MVGAILKMNEGQPSHRTLEACAESSAGAGLGHGGLVDGVADASDPRRYPASPERYGHTGRLYWTPAAPVLMLAGRAHYYEHGNAAIMRPPLEVLVGIGIEKLILTNAAGSLDPDMGPGSLMLLTDHINFSGSNPLFGEPTDRRFVGLTEAYDRNISLALEKAAAATGTPLRKGVYMWFSGPSFETPAEIRMARSWVPTRSACRPCPRSSSPASSACASPPAGHHQQQPA